MGHEMWKWNMQFQLPFTSILLEFFSLNKPVQDFKTTQQLVIQIET